MHGVNDRAQLAAAERMIQDRLRHAAMASGVTLVAPETVFFSHDTRLGQDVVVEPHVVFGPGVVVEEGAVIHSFSHLEGARIASGAGGRPVRPPAARALPSGPKAKVGNFVEIKNTELGAGAKVSHLTYLGDASIGAEANIGAGTITCNYDGFGKYRTRDRRGRLHRLEFRPRGPRHASARVHSWDPARLSRTIYRMTPWAWGADVRL